MNITRRKIIQTSALSLALPSFEAFATDEARPPLKRMVAFYVPNGIHMNDFYCEDEKQLLNLPPTLQPLAALKHKISLVRGMVNNPAKPDGPGDHASGTAAFLTVSHPKKTDGDDIFNGISIDQEIAKHLRAQTPLSSLQLGLEGGGSVGECDSGYSCAYSRNISWASATQPLPKIVNPGLLFDRLFEGTDPNMSAELLKINTQKQKSILDYVLAQTNELKKQISNKDRAKLDQYQTGIRELELKLASSGLGGKGCAEGDLASDLPDAMADVNVHSDVMTELMAIALQCQQTSIITYMLGNAGSTRSYDFLGAPGAHHEISHHQDIEANFEKLKKINIWEIKQFAKLIHKLDSIDEAEGSLLDQCCVFFSSEVSDGNRHNHDDLPVLYAGGLGGALKTGENIMAVNRSISEFYLSLAHSMGVPLQTFGDGRMPLDVVRV
jgi:Protein of unknown function (DUF1552)